MSRRILKINELLRREVSLILEQKLPFELGVITITSVDTSSDLKEAKIFISLLNKEKYAELSRDLERITPRIQKIINKRLRLKFVPKINFQIDHSPEKVQRIEEILREIKKGPQNK